MDLVFCLVFMLLIAQALHHFIISPSNSADAASNLSTKAGYARRCNVSHVTVEVIAYAAMRVGSHCSATSHY